MLSGADLSLCAMLFLTSPTLFCSLSIAFKKTTLFPVDTDMWMWLTKNYYDLLQVDAEMVFKIISITTDQIIIYGT